MAVADEARRLKEDLAVAKATAYDAVAATAAVEKDLEAARAENGRLDARGAELKAELKAAGDNFRDADAARRALEAKQASVVLDVEVEDTMARLKAELVVLRSNLGAGTRCPKVGPSRLDGRARARHRRHQGSSSRP